MTQPRTTVIACATVLEEMLPLMTRDMRYEKLEFGLHLHPKKLRAALQEAVDTAGENAETIVLGYGLCSMAVIGLTSDRATLVVPRIDDCIAIFLGSRAAYAAQSSAEPGTYYLTKGWIEVGDTPLGEYERMRDKYGEQRATRMAELMLRNYTRLAFVDTGRYAQQRYRDYARRTAAHFKLRYEEIAGSNELVRRMLFGPWDEGFVVARPGETIRYEDFRTTATGICNSPHGAPGAAGRDA